MQLLMLPKLFPKVDWLFRKVDRFYQKWTDCSWLLAGHHVPVALAHEGSDGPLLDCRAPLHFAELGQWVREVVPRCALSPLPRKPGAKRVPIAMTRLVKHGFLYKNLFFIGRTRSHWNLIYEIVIAQWKRRCCRVAHVLPTVPYDLLLNCYIRV
jgi:hypothetical protein